jgi:RNA polymerase sigma-70 factor (ECF subfamily)
LCGVAVLVAYGDSPNDNNAVEDRPVSDSAVHPTPVSLLEQLRRSSPHDRQAAWGRFVDLYTPLLFSMARRVGATRQDAADLVQDVFAVLLREMPKFRYRPDLRFRGWLFTIVRNKWINRLNKKRVAPPRAVLETVSVPDNVAEMPEAEYRADLVRRALQLMQAQFAEADWKACWQNVVEGRPVAEVAEELGLTVNQVYLAKSRILHWLRKELEGLLD